MLVASLFNRATRGHSVPTYLSSDHDPLYRFHQWQANLRILNVKEIKTVPCVPLSHPFVERLIGTIRRECLDRMLFWTAADLEMKLLDFQRCYNGHRTHGGLKGRTPAPGAGTNGARASLSETDGSRTVVDCIKRRSRRDKFVSRAGGRTCGVLSPSILSRAPSSHLVR